MTPTTAALRQSAAPWRWLAIGLVALAAAVAAVLGLRTVLPPGFDMVHFYHPTLQAWLAGETLLYDRQTAGFFSPPWTAWLLAPLGMMDLRTAMSALVVVSVPAIAAVALAQAKRVGAQPPALLAALTILAPYSLQVLLVGSLDAISLVGLYLAYRAADNHRPVAFGAALTLAAIRPQNLVLTGPVLLVWAWRQWSKDGVSLADGLRRAAPALVVPVPVVIASAIAFGLDWPLRWIHVWHTYPPIPYLVTSTYAATNLAGISPWPVVAGMAALGGLVLWRAWRRSDSTVELAVAANAALTPYMLSQSYLLLLALPWMLLMRRRPWAGVALYALGVPILIRAEGLWDRLGLLSVCFPLLVVVALLLSPGDRDRRPAEPP